MRFKILGSGGAIRIPRACCSCKICIEARLLGFPYKRLGQSLYLREEDILFDTPEDINEELNAHNVSDVKHIFYTHWHPDHTMGCRVIEELMDDRLEKTSINVYMSREKIELTINRENSLFPFYESLGYCKIITEDIIELNNICIERIKLLNGENNSKVLYCPCHSMYLPVCEKLHNPDLLIIELRYVNYMAEGVTNFERDNILIINRLKPGKVIFTHIEESDGLSFDEFKKTEDKYENFLFAFDGMEISI